jgi:hypothetical protein
MILSSKIHNLFVRALETGRKVHERKLSSLMKKMKESCKLDINQSVPENILSRPKIGIYFYKNKIKISYIN